MSLRASAVLIISAVAQSDPMIPELQWEVDFVMDANNAANSVEGDRFWRWCGACMGACEFRETRVVGWHDLASDSFFCFEYK